MCRFGSLVANAASCASCAGTRADGIERSFCDDRNASNNGICCASSDDRVAGDNELGSGHCDARAFVYGSS